MKLDCKDKILYPIVLLLLILAAFAYPAAAKYSDPFGAVIYPIFFAGILSGVVGFVSGFKFKGLYPLLSTVVFLMSIPIVFGRAQISNFDDLAGFGVPHIAVSYFGFFVGIIGRWRGMHKQKNISD